MMSFIKGYLFAILCACGLLFSSFQTNAQIPEGLILEGVAGTPANAANGKSIFDANCASCHAVHEKVVGPALKDVWKRWDDVELLKQFIWNAEKVITSGKVPYANNLYKQYKAAGYMQNNSYLSNQETHDILAWVIQETKNPTIIVKKNDDNTKGTETAGIDSNILTAIISGLTIVLVGVLGVLAALIMVLVRNLREREDLSEEEKEIIETGGFSIRKFATHPAFVGIAAFVFVSIAGQKTLDGMFTVGVQQGYAPEQPIPFSHKLHAGYYEIDCKYCHTGVEKSKNANIPSANICMNCHNKIRSTSDNMKKIYSAIENDEPIKWVRVHNLPDLAYFNHSQHVKVAGLDCENCHGEVKEMEVIQQHSLLTMGWCIDCHRQTEIKTENNDYYERLLKLHEGEKEPLKVEDIGGLECSKCHY